MSASTLVAALRARGFSLRVDAGSLRVTPKSSLTPSDRIAIRAELPALIKDLSPGEPWDQTEANRLMVAADSLVERLEVEGRHPEIDSAASMVRSANAARDLETVRLACSEFEAVVRAVAARSRQEKTSYRD